MEALLIRGFVLMLGLTGFGATVVTSPGSHNPNSPTVSTPSDGTTPNCLPNSPTYCGMC